MREMEIAAGRGRAFPCGNQGFDCGAADHGRDGAPRGHVRGEDFSFPPRSC